MDHPQPVSASVSPVKPLNVPSIDEDRRDFNLSSDTYVSDDSEKRNFRRNFEDDADMGSPQKSSLKSTGPSPKKSVAFHTALVERHTYSDVSDESRNDSEDPIDHTWAEVVGEKKETPPTPPPHTQATVASLLGSDTEDVDTSVLSEYRLRQAGHLDLLLTEKLEIFLSQEQHDELDTHLDQLRRAHKTDLNRNIDELLREMALEKPAPPDPVATLAQGQLYQHSPHSLQLSLALLMDSNRVLKAQNVVAQSSGLVLNDGIRGFTDDVAAKLFPNTDEPAPLSDDEYHDSFNRSYNSTEKLILNMLKSGSDLLLGDLTRVKHEASTHEESTHEATVKEESVLPGSFSADIKEEPSLADSSTVHKTHNPFVKPEDVSQVNQSLKSEPESSFNSNVKLETERHTAIKEESFVKHEMSVKAELSEDEFHFRQENLHEHFETVEIASRVVAQAPRNVKLVMSKTNSSESFERKRDSEPSDSGLEVYQDSTLEMRPAVEVRRSLAPLPEPKEPDSSILANSSNIHPPLDIALPQVQPQDTSLLDLSRKIQNDESLSFEESLSAENERDTRPANFLAIWRSQKVKKKPSEPQEKVLVPSLLTYNTADLSQYDKYRIPSTLQPKRFTGVSIVSKRTVSAGHETLDVSNFLPDISHGLDFEEQFRSMVANSTHEQRQPSFVTERLDPRGFTRPKEVPKKSKFHVPSFEIKRSTSVLSPRNVYNDIFEDSWLVKPTMRAEGMRTLPSMDRDDIKKIMQMKQAISQEEFSALKYAQHNTQITESKQHLPQKASIYSTGSATTAYPQMAVEFSAPAEMEPLTPEQTPAANLETFDDVAEDANRVTPESAPLGETDPEANTPHFAVKSVNHLRKNSPIKINSPVKLVKSGGSVTGITLDKPNQEPPFEVLNPPKDGALKPKDISIPNELPPLENRKVRDHTPALSTVSVPSLTEHATKWSKDGPVGVRRASTTTSRKASKPLDRGKLFFRVIRLKEIGLPEVSLRKALFNITLDNGVHCIKTPQYGLGATSVPIDKEFELTVDNSLEFILTMKALHEKPKGTLMQVKERKVVKSRNRLSRMFGLKDVITVTKFVPKDAHDPWKNKMATDGSFARCYVDLSQFEERVTGRAASFNLACFNEWETSLTGAVKSYQIAQLEVKMLFVPRKDSFEILPTSIKSAYEGLEDLRSERSFQLDGFLHQEGGDCETWKRRFFKLRGTTLTAYSEYSQKTRARINLAKVVEVIYVDKENLDRSSVNYRNFSDILLMENAFKIRFANGEIIDFGAPNTEQKMRWIKAIQEIVYRNKFRRQAWVQTMLERNSK